jgi:hypothetical protein
LFTNINIYGGTQLTKKIGSFTLSIDEVTPDDYQQKVEPALKTLIKTLKIK